MIFNGRPRCQFGARSARYDYRLSRLTGSSSRDVFVRRSGRIIRIVKPYFSRSLRYEFFGPFTPPIPIVLENRSALAPLISLPDLRVRNPRRTFTNGDYACLMENEAKVCQTLCKSAACASIIRVISMACYDDFFEAGFFG